MKDKRLNLIDNGLNEVFMFLNQLREKSDKDRDAYNILFNYQIEIAKARAELKNIDKRFQEYEERISKLRFEIERVESERDQLKSGEFARTLNERLYHIKSHIVDDIHEIFEDHKEETNDNT